MSQSQRLVVVMASAVTEGTGGLRDQARACSRGFGSGDPATHLHEAATHRNTRPSWPLAWACVLVGWRAWSCAGWWGGDDR